MGAYGEVWLARGLTGIFRAVKFVWRDRFESAEPFEREFRGVKESMPLSQESGQLGLHHVGQDRNSGFFYYVMDIADDVTSGQSIDPERYVPLTLKKLKENCGRVAVGECVRIGAHIARALAVLHAHGFVHRDIKPSNIVLVQGVPRLADLGLVSASTATGALVGTRGYLPPEGQGTPAADVYSLGKVLYELATGFGLEKFPQLPETIGNASEQRMFFRLNKVLLRACDPQMDRRYSSAREMAADLEALVAGGQSRRFTGWRSAALALLLILAGVVGLHFWQEGTTVEKAAMPATGHVAVPANAIAVLPLANLSGDKDQEYFSDGLTEEIIDALARQRDLRVTGRTSSFSFKGRNVSSVEIGRALNVSRFVEGSVQRSGTRVRIRLTLTRASDGTTEEIGTFTEELADIFALQDRVARAVVQKIAHRHVEERIVRFTRNPEAYDYYLHARALQTRTYLNSDKAAELYEKAVAADPLFALAWARLAAARFRRYSAGEDYSPSLVEATREAIDHALSANPDLPEALIMRARWLGFVKGDMDEAARVLARAESLQPPTAELRHAQATFAMRRGDWPEAFARVQEALVLDPQNGDHINSMALVYAGRGLFREADRLYERAIAIEGNAGCASIAVNNRVQLRCSWRGPLAALRLLDRAPAVYSCPWLRAWLLICAGRLDEARSFIEQMDSELGGGDGPGIQTSVRFPPILLFKVGMEEMAGRRAVETRSGFQKQYASGNRSPNVYYNLVFLNTLSGGSVQARALLEEWRREEEQNQSANVRLIEFNEPAALCYALLGEIDQALILLTERRAAGFHLKSHSARYSLRGGAQLDPQLEKFIQEEFGWASAQPGPDDEDG